MIEFKPNLIPNNKIDGTAINWYRRLNDPTKWYVSEKYDGIRAEIMFDSTGKCTIRTRALKLFRSRYINMIANSISAAGLTNMVIEGEIYCEGMRFNELIHFINSEDVTSVKSIKKMQLAKRKGDFPDRTLEWLTTYDHNFKINLFDIYISRANNIHFDIRLVLLSNAYIAINSVVSNFVLITQKTFDDVNGIISLYNRIEDRGGEGIIIKNKKHLYKLNRNTLNEGVVFKMKDEFNWFYGKILDVMEGTEVDPDAPKTINELGRSVTSKSIFDRSPSGIAKGFLVRMLDGNTLTVTLKGFDNYGKENLLLNKKNWIGLTIKFLAMKSTKINGVPRQAKYINNN